jgi:hypothetical protein
MGSVIGEKEKKRSLIRRTLQNKIDSLLGKRVRKIRSLRRKNVLPVSLEKILIVIHLRLHLIRHRRIVLMPPTEKSVELIKSP